MSPVESLTTADEWLAVGGSRLNAGRAAEWVVRRDCGAAVVFAGTVRDHSPGRSDVVGLFYEAYEEAVLAGFGSIVGEMRRRFPSIGRIALWHRTGELTVEEVAVIVAVSAAHRAEAFAAASFGIDDLKSTAPIWKLERWSGGESWVSACGAHEQPAFGESSASRPFDVVGGS